MPSSQYFRLPTRHTRSTAASKPIMSSALSYMSVAEPTVDISALDLKTSPASPKDAMSEVPRHNGVRSRNYDENCDDDGRNGAGNGNGNGIRDEGMDKIGDEDYTVSAEATSVVGTMRKTRDKGEFRGVTMQVPEYDEDYDEDNGNDDGGDGKEGKDRTGGEGCGDSSGIPPGGARNKATDTCKSKGVTEEISKYDEDYDEDDDDEDDDNEDDDNEDDDNEDEDEDHGRNTEDKPVVGTKGKGRGKATDKRRFGGSCKGRKCFRWTPKQERAAIAGMLEIRAEGEILGDLCFEELYNRLIARDPTWNHTVSGIHNAWHRRELVHEVTRAEARAKQEQEEQQAKEDKELGLAIRTKRTVKRKSATKKSAILSKYEPGDIAVDEETDEESMFVSKRRRTGSPSGTLRRPHLRELDTTPSCNLSAANLFTSPAPMPPSQTVLNLPTVTIGFKRHNNSSRRTREFAEVNTMNRFWNQVVATPMFDNLETAFMVVMVWVSDARKPHYMAQHDKADYTDFVRLVERAVNASGEEEVVVNVTAAR